MLISHPEKLADAWTALTLQDWGWLGAISKQKLIPPSTADDMEGQGQQLKSKLDLSTGFGETSGNTCRVKL